MRGVVLEQAQVKSETTLDTVIRTIKNSSGNLEFRGLGKRAVKIPRQGSEMIERPVLYLQTLARNGPLFGITPLIQNGVQSDFCYGHVKELSDEVEPDSKATGLFLSYGLIEHPEVLPNGTCTQMIAEPGSYRACMLTPVKFPTLESGPFPAIVGVQNRTGTALFTWETGHQDNRVWIARYR